MSELKAGDSLDFTVDGKTLTIKPLPFGRLKNILKVVFELTQQAGSGTLENQNIISLVEQYSGKILPELIHPAVEAGWIDEHLDLPTIRKMIESAVIVNGLQDFFARGKAGSVLTPKPSKNPTSPTPSESTGSTTSSDLPTVGGPKT